MTRPSQNAGGPGSQLGRSRAVVTGGAGFIGSHLVDRLLADGLAVLVVDDLSTGSTASINPRASFERRDIAVDELDGLFRSWRPSVVYHLAAQSSVPRSVHDPLHDLAVNVIGTHRVASAAAAARAGRLIFVSSGGAIYGECSRPATESTVPAPLSYYGVHKLAAESHVALAGLPYVVARPSNVYGSRQTTGTDGAVVAAFIDRASRGLAFEIHGDGRQTRDLIHVADAVDALIFLAAPDRPSGVFNLATGRQASVLQIADLAERACGRPITRTFHPRRPGDVTKSALSPAKLRRLGWTASVPLRIGLARLSRETSAQRA